MFIRRVHVRSHERAFLFRRGEPRRVLDPGTHWIFNPLLRVRVERYDVRRTYIEHPELVLMLEAGIFGHRAETLNLMDHERALVWIDGRFARICGPGRHALWKVFHKVRVEVVDTGAGLFEHPALSTLIEAAGTATFLEVVNVEAGWAGLLFRDGRFVRQLPPGRYALWRNAGRLRVLLVDLKEEALDVGGQEIMTADKVSLRVNALVTYRVTAPQRAVEAVDEYPLVLYREAQLALRAVIGTAELDALLSSKDAVVAELEAQLATRAQAFGVEVVSFGIRDIILPGEMRALMNRVTEARKAAEANLIARREETAAMRSQANTARILDNHPTLMKLRELEVLEKVAEKAQLSVVLGETGLGDRLMKLV